MQLQVPCINISLDGSFSFVAQREFITVAEKFMQVITILYQCVNMRFFCIFLINDQVFEM